MQYTLQTCRAKDKTGLMRVLGILSQNIRGHPFEVSVEAKYSCKLFSPKIFQDAFLHSLVTGLIGMKDEFEAEDFCTAVFDEFFFTCINVDNVVRHLMRLLWWTHAKLSQARLDTLLKVMMMTVLRLMIMIVLIRLLSQQVEEMQWSSLMKISRTRYQSQEQVAAVRLRRVKNKLNLSRDCLKHDDFTYLCLILEFYYSVPYLSNLYFLRNISERKMIHRLVKLIKYLTLLQKTSSDKQIINQITMSSTPSPCLPPSPIQSEKAKRYDRQLR